ncbi:MAG: EAL domain-containing protein [Eubacteriales bacterium]|nr:EAL domain-containing protein [Eubacteriales bacterium]
MKKESICDGNMEMELENAWKNDEFQVFLQPQVEVESGSIGGFEALIRWEHPTRGILEPQEFLPAMKGLCMIERLDYLVFEKVCSFLDSRIKERKELFSVSCNFVREHFEKADFADIVEDIRLRFQVPAEFLAVEITEGEAFADEETVQRNVGRLKELGYPVYLDDYGADKSTFGDLMFHSISHIKVDKKLIDHIEQENVCVLLQGLCDIAHRLAYQVVCEGVENKGQYEAAKKCGVDIIQGFYFFHPMKISKAVNLFDKNQ